MSLAFESWYADFANYGWWEIPAVITALLYILLAAKKNRWCFVYGLISSLIYVYLTYRLKLYFDTFINAYYIGMSVYGWVDWSASRKNEDVPIVRLGYKKLFTFSIITFALSMLIGWWADLYTDNILPYWDSFTTLFALLATYWVVKRYIENWMIWMLIDLISFFIYLYKGLPLTSFLFLTYSIMSWYGYKNWNKTWLESTK